MRACMDGIHMYSQNLLDPWAASLGIGLPSPYPIAVSPGPEGTIRSNIQWAAGSLVRYYVISQRGCCP
jgi:hypothetical protein